MASVPDYGERRDFNPSPYHVQLSVSSTAEYDGLQTDSHSYYGSSRCLPLQNNTHATANSYNFDTEDSNALHSILSSQGGDWQVESTGFDTAPWPAHQPGLRLMTNFDLEHTDLKPPRGLVSPSEPVSTASTLSDKAIDPAQLDSSGVDPGSPKKRLIEGAAGMDAHKKHKRIKSSSTPARGSQSDVQEALEDDEKREKFLARNRVAASKCRQKKKEWTGQLEDKARELSNQRSYLTATVNLLRNELLGLKCQCLEHSDCDCDKIRDYLKSTVAALSPTASLYYDPAMTGTSTSTDEARTQSANSTTSLSWSDQAAASPESISEAMDS